MAGTTVGKLNAILTADSSGFAAAFQKSESIVKGFSNTVTSITGLVTNAIGRLSFAGIAAGFQSMSKAIDDTGDLASRIGVTAQALQELRYAAKLSGSSADEFDTAFEKMTRTIGEAAQTATGPARTAIERLGLSVTDLANKSPDQAFVDISEAVSKIGNPAERAAVAVDLFGKSGQKLLNTLMLGRDGLDQFAARARQLGISLSAIDVAKIQSANDAIDDVNLTLGGVKNMLAVGVAPFIEAFAMKFLAVATSGESMSKRISAGMERVANATALVADTFDALSIVFKAARMGFDQLVSFFLRGIQKIFDGISTVSGVIGSDFGQATANHFKGMADEWQKSTYDVAKSIEDQLVGETFGEKVKKFFSETTAAANAAAEEVANSSKSPDPISVPPPDLKAFVKGLTQLDTSGTFAEVRSRFLDQITAIGMQLISPDEMSKATEDLQKSFKKFSQSFGRSVYTDTRTDSEQAIARIEDLGIALDDGAIGWDTYARGVDRAMQALNDMNKVELPSAAEFGSAEAYKLSRPIEMQMMGLDAGRENRERENNEVLKKIKEEIQRLREETQDRRPINVVSAPR